MNAFSLELLPSRRRGDFNRGRSVCERKLGVRRSSDLSLDWPKGLGDWIVTVGSSYLVPKLGYFIRAVIGSRSGMSAEAKKG